MSRLIWVRADVAKSKDERKKIATTALESGFDTILAQESDSAAFKKLGKFTLLTVGAESGNAKPIKAHAADAASAEPVEIGRIIEINSNEDIEAAKALMNTTKHVLIIAKNWKVIPLENLIAAFQKSETKLIAQVSSAEEAQLFFKTLEVGTDGVALATADMNEIKRFKTFLQKYDSEKIQLVEGAVTKIQSLGIGDRVCIDTCSLLKIGEGMLIGSQSTGLFLVHSETLKSEYVNSRPFRVNAGPVHAYVLCPGGKTKYLSEIKAGDEVLIVDTKGDSQTAIVGRVKIEKRPLMLIEAEAEGQKYSTILQNAETIRLVSNGKPVSVVNLKVGDKITMALEKSARHFGTAIQETILEK